MMHTSKAPVRGALRSPDKAIMTVTQFLQSKKRTV